MIDQSMQTIMLGIDWSVVNIKGTIFKVEDRGVAVVYTELPNFLYY